MLEYSADDVLVETRGPREQPRRAALGLLAVAGFTMTPFQVCGPPEDPLAPWDPFRPPRALVRFFHVCDDAIGDLI